MADSLVHGNETSGSIKGGFFWLADRFSRTAAPS
jgi:hypothetical protein